MFRDDRAESSAADNDDIEIARLSGDGFGGAVERFLQSVAEEPPHIVQREGGGLGCQ